MSVERVLEFTMSMIAEASLAAQQYTCVKLGTNDQECDVAGANEAAIGIVQNAPAIGQEAEVQIHGVAKARAGAQITKGAWVGPDSDGEVIPVTTDAYRVVGIALKAASAADEIIPVLISIGRYAG